MVNEIQLVDLNVDNPYKVVPTKQVKPIGYQNMLSSYKNMKVNEPGSHTAKCIGLRSMVLTGYSIPTRSDIILRNGELQYYNSHHTAFHSIWSNDTYVNFFPEWKDSIVIKVNTDYMSYLTEDYNLMMSHVSFPDQEGWYSASGILKHEYGPLTIAAFIITTQKDLFIPAGTPISQLTYIPSEQPSVNLRQGNQADMANAMQMMKWRSERPNPKDRRYSELKEYPWYNYD